jgi:hypothetical protein
MKSHRVMLHTTRCTYFAPANAVSMYAHENEDVQRTKHRLIRVTLIYLSHGSRYTYFPSYLHTELVKARPFMASVFVYLLCMCLIMG